MRLLKTAFAFVPLALLALIDFIRTISNAAFILNRVAIFASLIANPCRVTRTFPIHLVHMPH